MKTPMIRKNNQKFLKQYSEQQRLENRQQMIFSQGRNTKARMNDHDPVYATPIPKKHQMMMDNTDIFHGNSKQSAVNRMSRTGEIFS